MLEIIKRDILAVLSELAEILKAKGESDASKIKGLSNHVIHNASVFQDGDSVSVAILIYSLSKIIERKEAGLDHGKVLMMLDSCISSLKNNDDNSFRKSVKEVFGFIKGVDKRLRLYIQEVINQAQIKKGCKLCEHGISVARAAEILGISQWELMQYLGKTTLIDRFGEPVSVPRRLKIARSLFS